MTSDPYAQGASAIPAASDEGPTAAAVAPQESKRNESPDCHSAAQAGQALRVIEGETLAANYLAGLQAQRNDPDELALIVSMLYGAPLRGFCRVIEKALGVHHA